jgi:hypothetical protein
VYKEYRKPTRTTHAEAISPALAGIFWCEYHITKGWDMQEKRWTGKMPLLGSPFQAGPITQTEYEQAFLFIYRLLQRLQPSAQPEARQIPPYSRISPRSGSK